jgi:hypothetical protein
MIIIIIMGKSGIIKGNEKKNTAAMQKSTAKSAGVCGNLLSMLFPFYFFIDRSQNIFRYSGIQQHHMSLDPRMQLWADNSRYSLIGILL